jgi:hypothetical protein
MWCPHPLRKSNKYMNIFYTYFKELDFLSNWYRWKSKNVILTFFLTYYSFVAYLFRIKGSRLMYVCMYEGWATIWPLHRYHHWSVVLKVGLRDYIAVCVFCVCLYAYPALLLNGWTNIHGTWYEYQGIWTNPNSVIHKSFPSIIPTLHPLIFLRQNLHIAWTPVPVLMKRGVYITPLRSSQCHIL